MVRLALDATTRPVAASEADLSPGAVEKPVTPSVPAWPVTLLLGLYPVWWALGVLDMILIPFAVVMGLYLLRTPGLRVPRGFGLWMLFLGWAAFSLIEVNGIANYLNFFFKYAIYLSSTVLFVYIYNARRHLDARKVLGLLTIVWLTTVAGGYLGVAFPGGVLRTPMSYVVSVIKVVQPGTATILNNELVQFMVVRRFAQYNPTSFFGVAPRPTAPFRFTNNWGFAYSVLLPTAFAYALLARPRRKILILAVLIPASLVPALLTLNRGMMVGVVIAMVYASIRLLFRGRPGPLIATAIFALIAFGLFSALGIQNRLDTRLGHEGSSTDIRASLYEQSLQSVPASPIFGKGTPQGGNATDPNAPPVGTQGQVWMVLVSHGPVALGAFLGWFALGAWQSRRRTDVAGFACHVALTVATIELFYYGTLPYGMPMMMSIAALALRPETEPETEPATAALALRPEAEPASR